MKCRYAAFLAGLDEVGALHAVEEEVLQGRAIEDLEAWLVNRAEVPVETRDLATGIAEEEAREGAVEIWSRRGSRPCLLGSPRVGEKGITLEIVMTVISPIRVQQPEGSVSPARLRPARDIRKAVGDPGEERVPTRCPRANHEIEFVTREDLGPAKVEIGFVPPVEQNQVGIDL